MISARRDVRGVALSAVIAVILAAVVAVAAGCTSSSLVPTPGSSGSSRPTTGGPATLPNGPLDYVSVGDSYAAGYQPAARGPGGTTRNGFAYQLVGKAKARGYDLNLVNFGCSGATTRSATTTSGCAARNLGPAATSYDRPQIEAAAGYIRAHRDRVGLVTIVLGGNDVTRCAGSATANEATSCVSAALGRITTSLTAIARELRAAAAPSTRIVGLTYPDVFLGEARSDDPERRQFAGLSAAAFRTIVNPQLATAYQQAGADFADVTAATGAYTPEAVAKICALTYYCAYRDIHPRTAGYAVIADLVARQLPPR